MTILLRTIAIAAAALMLSPSLKQAPGEDRTTFLYMPDGLVITMEEAVDTCLDTLRMGDAQSAMTYALTAYDRGCTEAVYPIALMYMYGMGVERDFTAAASWLMKGVMQGNALCLYQMGQLQEMSGGPNANQIAKQYYMRSADQGSLSACLRAGEMLEGLHNYHDMFRYALKAACMGSEIGYDRLGQCYEYGRGVEKNAVCAQVMYALAIRKGSVDAMNHLAHFYISGSGGTRNVTMGVHLYERALEKGSVSAALYLGELYERGRDVEKNMDRAIELYRYAASYGNLVAEYRLDQLRSTEKPPRTNAP